MKAEKEKEVKRMKLTKELFVLRDGENFILYAPLKNALAKVSPTYISILKKIKNQNDVDEGTIKKLKDLGFITDKEEEPMIFEDGGPYSPTDLVIIPGTDCNLRCKYCYANSGEVQKKTLNLKIAKAAIDLILKNAKRKNKEALLTFTGGGEPFYGKNWNIVNKCTEYAKKEKKLKLYICAATNGILSKHQLEWIIKNLNSIQLSIDGPEDIQNYQRPLKNGKGSFEYVLNTIKYFEKNNFNYVIRSTITNYNVSKLEEIAKFFKKIAPSAEGHYFEPVTKCGRCATKGISEPDMHKFAENLIKIKKRHYNRVGFFVSKARFSIWNCGAVGEYFVLTPEGKVSTCARGLKEFHIGNYSHNKKTFTLNLEKIKHLKERNVFNLPHCSDCFAKYHCAGGCLSRACIRRKDIFNPEDERCHVHREYLKLELKMLLNNKKIKQEVLK